MMTFMRVLVLLTIFISPAVADKFNLNENERDLMVHFLFEPFGYLDETVRLSDGRTAAEELASQGGLESGFDLADWIRTNTFTDFETSTECAMVWWIQDNDGVNVPTASNPPEAADWTTRLIGFVDSINSGFLNVSEAQRDLTSSREIFDETVVIGRTLGSGKHLQFQQSAWSKARRVLQD